MAVSVQLPASQRGIGVKNLIMSDCPLGISLPQEGETVLCDLSSMRIANCAGCFGCWTRTPGRCVIRDDAVTVYPLIAQAERVLYVTSLLYGGYSRVMKTMLERAIPIQQAFIHLVKGECHHLQRAVKPKDAVILAYGDTSPEEQRVFRSLVARNALNMCFEQYAVRFVSAAALKETVLEEVSRWERS